MFFDLDSSTIRDDARAILSRNADYMKRWTSTRINVEGHCDERGSAEYNLGLGERRANAVKAYLVGLGIGGRSRHQHLQGQGSARLHRVQRIVLAAEPSRTLRVHREVADAPRRLETEGRPSGAGLLLSSGLAAADRRYRRLGGDRVGGGTRIGGGRDRPADHEVGGAGGDGFGRSQRARLIVLAALAGRPDARA